jgi:hypothetical protein
MNIPRSLEHWDRGFESHSRHDCLCAFILFCVVLCVRSGLATGWSPVQGVLLTVYKIKKLKKLPISTRTVQPLIDRFSFGYVVACFCRTDYACLVVLLQLPTVLGIHFSSTSYFNDDMEIILASSQNCPCMCVSGVYVRSIYSMHEWRDGWAGAPLEPEGENGFRFHIWYLRVFLSYVSVRWIWTL